MCLFSRYAPDKICFFLTFNVDLDLIRRNYGMTLVLKMEKKLCSGQGQFKHLIFNCDLNLGQIEKKIRMTLVLVKVPKVAN